MPIGWRRCGAAVAERTVLAGASTHAGEESMLIEAHRRLRSAFPRLLTIIVPRHPDRGPSILDMARAAELKAALRSRGELPRADTDIYIADTLGELGLIYRLAPIVFVGGSLARHGGQNPIEPVKLGAAILHGPHVWNFAEIYAALDAAHGAEEISGVESFAAARRRLAQGRARAGVGDCRRANERCRARRRRSNARSPRSSRISCALVAGSARAMREPAFWWRKRTRCRQRCWRRWRRSTARSRRGGSHGLAGGRASPSFASAI